MQLKQKHRNALQMSSVAVPGLIDLRALL